MSPGAPSAAQFLTRLFALALYLYPARVRRAYGDEMQAVFRLKVDDAAQAATPGRAGAFSAAWALCLLACREARDLPRAILSAHFHAVGGRMQSLFPATSDQTPWPTALLSLLPFIIAGPLRLIVSYQPGWMPGQQSLYYLLYLALVSTALAGGLALGAIKKFPRWAYPYLICLAFALDIMIKYGYYLLHYSASFQNGYYLFMLSMLALLCLPGLRAFYRNISRDWTLISYGLYGFALFLLQEVEYEVDPHLTLRVLLPSLITIIAALAHLRIRNPIYRIAVLVVGTLAGLLIWLAPLFTGMITPLAGIIIGMLMVGIYGTILVTLILAPMIVTHAIHVWRASRTPR